MTAADRAQWLKEKRRLAEERMDTLWASVYDQNWGATIDPTHESRVRRFLELCPPGAQILDAACGTGKYWPLILAGGRQVFGIDQSREMLAAARTKFPNIPVQKIGMQEMDFHAIFDGAVCMDSMEMIFPEDWPLVLLNLYRALKPKSYLYFTVEMADEKEIEQAYQTGLQLGLPVVYGEWAHEGGYHYYPELARVREWIVRSGFHLLEDSFGDSYQHFLVKKELS